MKNLTVNMPLAVPHQKPPSKYASHPYAFYALDGYGTSMQVVSIGLRQAKFFELENIKTSVGISSVIHTQVLFEPYYLNPQPHEQYKGSTSIAESGHSVTRVLFEPIYLEPHQDSYKSMPTKIDSIRLTQLLFEPIRYKHPTPDSLKTTVAINSINVTQKLFP